MLRCTFYICLKVSYLNNVMYILKQYLFKWKKIRLTEIFIDLSKVVHGMGVGKFKSRRGKWEKKWKGGWGYVYVRLSTEHHEISSQGHANMDSSGNQVEHVGPSVRWYRDVYKYLLVLSWCVRSFSSVVKYSVISVGGLPSWEKCLQENNPSQFNLSFNCWRQPTFTDAPDKTATFLLTGLLNSLIILWEYVFNIIGQL